MFIQCLIERSDGSDTLVDFEQVRYRFTKNSNGDHVCFVGGDEHRRRLLMMGTATYRIYDPPKNLAGPQGGNPEPMKTRKIKPFRTPEPQEKTIPTFDMIPDEEAKPALVDYDWDLKEKNLKVGEFRGLSVPNFKLFVDKNRENVMKWPIDVRRELAKKLDKWLPELDPGIEGFNIGDYIQNTGDP